MNTANKVLTLDIKISGSDLEFAASKAIEMYVEDG
jgi:hypothetical protein